MDNNTSISKVEETSIEVIKKHIVLINNKPVIDKKWFYQFILESIKNEYISQGVIPGQKITINQYVYNFFNISKNIKKINTNLKYQEKFKKLLDDIDEKLEDLNSESETLEDPSLYKKIFNATVMKLVDRHKELCQEYYNEYENSLVEISNL